MKLKYWLFIPLAGILTSCKWGEPQRQNHSIAKDTLNYSYQNLRMTSDGCSDKTDSNCAVCNISYPKFSGQKKLDDTVRTILSSMLDSSKKGDTSLTNIGRAFVTRYKGDQEDNKKNAAAYKLKAYGRVIRQDSSILLLEMGAHIETGGAHPSEKKYFVNWNTKSDTSIGLDDVLISGYKKPLTEMAEKVFRTEEKLDPGATLRNDYFFKDEKFALNNNFAITPAGIRFYYNENEIKPYAAGPTDLFLPYSLLKPLLRRHTVVSQYIK